MQWLGHSHGAALLAALVSDPCTNFRPYSNSNAPSSYADPQPPKPPNPTSQAPKTEAPRTSQAKTRQNRNRRCGHRAGSAKKT